MIRPRCLLPVLLLTAACATTGEDDATDGIDEAALGTGKADLAAWSGGALAGAVRAANTLTLAELDDDAALAARAAKAIVARRPLRGIAALDAVPYVGPVALTRLVAYADAQGWTTSDMAPVPAGPFTMGHPGGFRFEPLHEVMLSAYWIDRFEVTNADWAACIAAGACRPLNGDHYHGAGYTALGDRPVTAMQWYEADAYCAWAGKRLPSEAQWEKAARGPADLRVQPWGDAPRTCERAQVVGCQGAGTPRPAAIGTHPAGSSPYGVEDLIGNVREFVSDSYNEFEPTCATPCVDPEGIPASAADHGYHGVRGGSFGTIAGVGGLLLHERGGHWWSSDIGFRCALQ